MQYCKNCPMRNATKRLIRGNDKLSFDPPYLLQKCLECHLRHAERIMDDTRKNNRLTPKQETE